MKILVTGGAGFIGTHLIKRLLEQKNSVVSIDNLMAGLQQNADKFISDKNYKFYNADCTDFNKLNQIFQKEKFDAVYHLAANSNIMMGSDDPTIDKKNTFETTATVLECMIKNNVKKFFFSSTSTVYGAREDELLAETLGGLQPVSYYGGYKAASEDIISAFTHMNGLETLIFRFPNVIGSGLTHGVIFDFVKRLLKNSTELKVLGNGTQTKEYIYIDDLIDAIIRFMEKLKPGMEILNVGTNSLTNVKKIAELTVQAMGLKNARITYSEGSIGWKGDINRFKFDTSKITSLGWKSKYSSDEAVKLTLEKYVKEIKG